MTVLDAATGEAGTDTADPIELDTSLVSAVAGLRDAREVAAIETERVARTESMQGAAGALALLGLRIRSLGSADAAERGLRYRPVIWSVLAVVALAFFLPGRDDAGTPVDVAAPAPAVPTTVLAAPAPAPTPTVAPTPTTPPPAPAPGVATPAPAPARPTAPSTTVAPQAPPPAASPTTVPAPPPTSPPAPEPLRISGWGWAASDGSPPIGGTAVPDGALPVANRLGQVDKVSFVRLSGTDAVLRLDEHADGTQEPFGAAGVVACPILDAGWAEAPGQSLADAPAWSDDCIAGADTDGTWSFDLGGVDPTRADGFALVPSPSAPPEFQITFATS